MTEYTWNYFIKELDNNDSYSQLEKQKLVKAFSIFQEHLCDDFFRDPNIKDHFMWLHLINYAPWTRKWLIWFSDCIETVAPYKNCEKIISDFKKYNLARERFLLLKNAYRFANSGFNIVFEPIIDTERGMKKPDLQIENKKTHELIYVEISELEKSDQAKEASVTIENLFHTLMFLDDIIYAGNILSILSRDTIAELSDKLQALAKKAKKDKIIQELFLEGKIHIAIANKYNNEFIEWCNKNGFNSNGQSSFLSGPPISVDEIHRAKHKLSQKMKQLNEKYLNMVIIYNNHLFNGTNCSNSELSSLEECVFKHDSLLFCSFITQSLRFNASNSETNIFGSKKFIKNYADVHYEEGFLAFNRYNYNKVSPNTIARIMDCF